MDATDCLQVTTTTDDEDAARVLAAGMVQARLAACVQVVGPITSVYRWEGAVETAAEYQLVAKTTGARLAALEGWLRAHHSYDVPELVATPIVAGGADYLRWIAEETAQESGARGQ